jgi:hypothetical protein
VAEVGAGVVGEQHGDEAKLVARSAGPGNGRRCGVDGAVLSQRGRMVSAMFWRLLAGMAWWSATRCQGTARGGEAGAAWRLLQWRARRSSTWRVSSSGATTQGGRAEQVGSGDQG